MNLTRMLRIVIILVVGLLVLALAAALVAYPPVYVYRVLAWQESDPGRPIARPATLRRWKPA